MTPLDAAKFSCAGRTDSSAVTSFRPCGDVPLTGFVVTFALVNEELAAA